MAIQRLNLTQTEPETSSHRIDLDNQTISTQDAEQYSSFALIRKRSVKGFFGHVYFLEKRMVAGKSMLGLYGGEIEHTDPTKWELDRDRTPVAALARELNEELGSLGKGKSQKFRPADLHEFASLYRDSEGREKKAVDIYRLDDEIAEHIHKKAIKHRRNVLIEERSDLERDLENALEFEKEKEIKARIEDINSTVGGRPVRVRRWFGIWIHLRWTWPCPLFWRITPDWANFSPIAAYTLLTDARILENIARK